MSVESIFRDAEERVAAVKATSGTVPPELRGTLLRNGGGRMRVGDQSLGFFDAAGVIAGLGFRDGSAVLRVRFVKTPLFESEKAGKLVYRRSWTNLPGRWRNLGNVALAPLVAHDVYAWNGRIYATGYPGEDHWALDPATLDTVGPARFAPKGAQQSPMPRPDPVSGRLIAYYVTPGFVRTDAITIVELDADWKIVKQASAPLAHRLAQVHDVAFSAKHYVVIENPQRLDVLGVLAGKRAVFDTIGWEPGPAVAVVIPRDGSAPVHIPLPEGNKHAFHLFNAYDDGDKLIVDGCFTSVPTDFSATLPAKLREQRGDTLGQFPHTEAVRLTLDVNAKTATSRKLATVFAEGPEVNPAFHGRPYRFAWGASSGGEVEGTVDPALSAWGRSVARFDFETGSIARWHRPGSIVSQPSFAARAGGTAEDDGWVLAWVLDLATEAASVVILDARDLTLVAELDLAGHLPGTSHCRFEASIDLRGPDVSA
jgi:carotenoid cleavage dioxygenase-like enzyme